MAVTFAVERITDDATGQQLDAVVKTTTTGGYGDDPRTQKETWCTILDLDRLFDACTQKWCSNWNLDKVIEAIRSSEIT